MISLQHYYVCKYTDIMYENTVDQRCLGRENGEDSKKMTVKEQKIISSRKV